MTTLSEDLVRRRDSLYVDEDPEVVQNPKEWRRVSDWVQALNTRRRRKIEKGKEGDSEGPGHFWGGGNVPVDWSGWIGIPK